MRLGVLSEPIEAEFPLITQSDCLLAQRAWVSKAPVRDVPFMLESPRTITMDHDDILELLNTHGLTSRQSMNLLERLGRIIAMCQRMAKGTRHDHGDVWNPFSNGHV